MHTLSHDPFARVETVKRRVSVGPTTTCSWCGQQHVTRKGLPYLFEYGTGYDGPRGLIHWHHGLFCCKGCHNAYHGV